MKRKLSIILMYIAVYAGFTVIGCDSPSRLNFGKTSAPANRSPNRVFILIPSLPSPYMEQKTKPCSMTVFLADTYEKLFFLQHDRRQRCLKKSRGRRCTCHRA